MSQAWLDILKRYGWHLEPGEYTWVSTAPDELVSPPGLINLHVVERANRNHGFEALGTLVTADARRTK